MEEGANQRLSFPHFRHERTIRLDLTPVLPYTAKQSWNELTKGCKMLHRIMECVEFSSDFEVSVNKHARFNQRARLSKNVHRNLKLPKSKFPNKSRRNLMWKIYYANDCPKKKSNRYFGWCRLSLYIYIYIYTYIHTLLKGGVWKGGNLQKHWKSRERRKPRNDMFEIPVLLNQNIANFSISGKSQDAGFENCPGSPKVPLFGTSS